MLLLALLLISAVSGHELLFGRIPIHDKRFHTYNQVLDLMPKADARVIVETCTSRYGSKRCEDDGCSTIIFGHWASMHNATFHSVHHDEALIRLASRSIDRDLLSVDFVHANSIPFLKSFKSFIDVLVIDSEAPFPDYIACQYHHYRQISAAYDKLHRDSIVLMDDCDGDTGKCRLAIEFLQLRGWSVTRNDYAAVLRYFGTALPKVVRTADGRTIIKARQTLAPSPPAANVLLSHVTSAVPYTFVPAAYGDLPHGAVKVSLDKGDPWGVVSCYVGRASFHDAAVHGCIQPQLGVLSFPYGGMEFRLDKYEALVIHPGYTYRWEGDHGGHVPENAVLSRGQYVGRIMFNGMWIAGKIEPACRCIYVPMDGKEVQYREYEVLTVVPRA